MARLAGILKVALALGLAAVFMAAGSAKLAAIPQMIDIFERFRLPSWFMYLTGVIECAGALGLLVPAARLRAISAALLSSTMIAGAGFHVLYDPPAAAIPAVVLAALCGYVAVSAWRSAVRKVA